MQKKIELRLLPSQAAGEAFINEHIAAHTGITPGQVSGFQILKRSIDARGKQTWINLTVNAFIMSLFSKEHCLIFILRM